VRVEAIRGPHSAPGSQNYKDTGQAAPARTGGHGPPGAQPDRIKPCRAAAPTLAQGPPGVKLGPNRARRRPAEARARAANP
jgi:hypothetical protein